MINPVSGWQGSLGQAREPGYSQSQPELESSARVFAGVELRKVIASGLFVLIVVIIMSHRKGGEEDTTSWEETQPGWAWAE